MYKIDVIIIMNPLTKRYTLYLYSMLFRSDRKSTRLNSSLFFFFNDAAPPEIYPLPLHDALPIFRATRPNVGRRPVTPHRIAGLTMLPPVSLPIENATSAAAVAAPGPALDPDAPSSKSHGFIV